MSSDIPNNSSNNRIAKGLPGFLRRTIRSTNVSSSSSATTEVVPLSLSSNGNVTTSGMNPNPDLTHESRPSLLSSSSSSSPSPSSSFVDEIIHSPRLNYSKPTTSTVTMTSPPPPPPPHSSSLKTTKTSMKQDTIKSPPAPPLPHPTSSSPSSTGNNNNSTKRTYKESVMDKIMSEQPVLNVSELKKSGWNGIPPIYRPKAWKLLLGYLPTNVHRRTQTLDRKRNEYQDAIRQFYDINDNSRTFSEQETLRQVLVDVPRTAPDIPLFRRQEIRTILSRLLYVWAMKHPASSYVQGINDLATPLIVVFLSEYAFHYHYGTHVIVPPENMNDDDDDDNNKPISTQFILDQVLDGTIVDVLNQKIINPNHHTESIITPEELVSSSSSAAALSYLHLQSSSTIDDFSSKEILSLSTILTQVEADVYWCLTNLLSGIQDHYTSDQPGVQRMILRLEELIRRIDDPLIQHFQNIGVEFIQFAFKWMNCLLLREFTLPCVIRLWDTYFSEGEGGFEIFHVYVCAAFLCHFSADIRRMSFDEAFGFLQNLPTSQWTDSDIEILLSQAFVLSTLFQGSDAHLSTNSHKTM